MAQERWPESLQHLLQWTQRDTSRDKVDSIQKRFSFLFQQQNQFLQEHSLSHEFSIIKVTGTNGKGSVCSMLASSLIQDQKKTGLFTSPHLVSITERIQINGLRVSLSRLDHHAQILSPWLKEIVSEYGEEYFPTFFEILVLIALRIFAEENIDIAIFEAGIGGASDPTSILPEVVSAITTIDIDHPTRLGGTREKIALNKAGIASACATLVTGPSIQGKILKLIEKQSEKRKVTVVSSKEEIELLHQSLQGIDFQWRHEQERMDLHSNLIGDFQLENFSIVATLFQILWKRGIVHSLDSLKGISQTRWPGRMEYFEGNSSFKPPILMDVAHNPHAMQALQKTLDSFIPFHKRVILYGVSNDKDYQNCLKQITQMAEEIYLVAGFYRSCSLEEMQNSLDSTDSIQGTFVTLEEAVSTLQKRYGEEKEKFLVFAGSVFLIGEVRQIFNL